MFCYRGFSVSRSGKQQSGRKAARNPPILVQQADDLNSLVRSADVLQGRRNEAPVYEAAAQYINWDGGEAEQPSGAIAKENIIIIMPSCPGKERWGEPRRGARIQLCLPANVLWSGLSN